MSNFTWKPSVPDQALAGIVLVGTYDAQRIDPLIEVLKQSANTIAGLDGQKMTEEEMEQFVIHCLDKFKRTFCTDACCCTYEDDDSFDWSRLVVNTYHSTVRGYFYID